MADFTKFLCIAVPTYNRSRMLDAQLERLVNSVGAQWERCQLLISDNASTDDTAQVCTKWQERLGEKCLVYRQPQNLGLIGNFVFCLHHSTGHFTWMVSDDDPIAPEAVTNVLAALGQSPSPGFLHLNYRTTNFYDGAVVQERVYPWLEDQCSSPGTDLFARCLQYNEIYISCLSAFVIDTQLGWEAVQSWPQGRANIAYPVYVAGYASLRAPMRLSTAISLTYPLHTMSHVGRWLATLFYDLPQIYLRLARLGFVPSFMRGLILQRISFVRFMLKYPVDFFKSLAIYWNAYHLPR